MDQPLRYHQGFRSIKHARHFQYVSYLLQYKTSKNIALCPVIPSAAYPGPVVVGPLLGSLTNSAIYWNFFLSIFSMLLCVFSRIRVALTIWIHCASLGVRADSHKRAIRFLANYRSLVRAMSTEGRYESSSRLPSKHTSGSSSSWTWKTLFILVTTQFQYLTSLGQRQSMCMRSPGWAWHLGHMGESRLPHLCNCTAIPCAVWTGG